jgi:mono/diheme cytochrome c family protein
MLAAGAQSESQESDTRAQAAAKVERSSFDEDVRPILDRHCITCHSGDKPKGKLDLQQLSSDFADEAAQRRWLAVQKKVTTGEMPPKAKPRPTPDEIQSLSDWVTGEVAAAAAAQGDGGRVVLRRLNRAEYENTVRDLLGINIELQQLLPEDAEAHGFDNVGEALHTSSFLMERYLEAADAALNVAIANAPRPKRIDRRLQCENQHQVKSTTEKVFRKTDDALMMFSSSQWQAITMSEFYPPDRGTYRIRISAYGIQNADKPVTFRVDAGPMLMGTKNHLVGYFDVPPDQPTVVEFTDFFDARNTIRILPYGLESAQAVDKIGADTYEGPGLAVNWVEVEGPLHDTWPPESHRRIFGDLLQGPDERNRYRLEVISSDPTEDAARILHDFARRAFRRPVTEDDVRPFLDLFETKRAEGYSFEQAVRVGLKGIMVSPRFLFLDEKPGRLDDFALASRLSYFLWSTMPDDELLALAESTGRHSTSAAANDAEASTDGTRSVPATTLADPETLHAQVERMLNSHKAREFTKNFVGQWLNLRDIDFTEPDHLLYPEFDDMLKAAIVDETHLFFEEVLKDDLSLTNFVASDFTMLNERLAKHYGIPGVEGHEFRNVPLPPDSHRGGVLTMASVLKVSANGTTTSPVIRGAYVLDRILGTPPDPPPPGVPAIEPDIRGATTIREQLAKHREIESCATCHVKIDPPGFALESFDVIGGWRENYRSRGNGKPVTIDGRRMHYLSGPAVDPSGVLADGREFRDIDEFRQLLLADKDQLARALTVKLLTYGTGGAPAPTDRQEVEAILGRVRAGNCGFRTLVHEIVQSPLFQDK